MKDQCFSALACWDIIPAKINVSREFPCIIFTLCFFLLDLHVANIWCVTLPHPHQVHRKILTVSFLLKSMSHVLYTVSLFALESPSTSSSENACAGCLKDAGCFSGSLSVVVCLFTSDILFFENHLIATYIFTSDLHKGNWKLKISHREKCIWGILRIFLVIQNFSLLCIHGVVNLIYNKLYNIIN